MIRKETKKRAAQAGLGGQEKWTWPGEGGWREAHGGAISTTKKRGCEMKYDRQADSNYSHSLISGEFHP